MRFRRGAMGALGVPDDATFVTSDFVFISPLLGRISCPKMAESYSNNQEPPRATAFGLRFDTVCCSAAYVCQGATSGGGLRAAQNVRPPPITFHPRGNPLLGSSEGKGLYYKDFAPVICDGNCR